MKGRNSYAKYVGGNLNKAGSTHLTNKQHLMPRKQATTIFEEVQQWPGVVQIPSEFEVPAFVEVPVDGVTVWSDGSKCELDDGKYIYVYRQIDSIKHY